MDRRSFIKYAGFGTLTLMFGGMAFRIGGVWWDQNAGKGFKILSNEESVIILALADTLFPGDAQGLPNGVNVGLPEFFDEYLQSVPEITSKLLRVLLHLIDDMSVVSDFGLTRFHRRPRVERIAILNAWDSSMVGARRGILRSIKLILSMGYFEHPVVLKAAGIDFACLGDA